MESRVVSFMINAKSLTELDQELTRTAKRQINSNEIISINTQGNGGSNALYIVTVWNSNTIDKAHAL